MTKTAPTDPNVPTRQRFSDASPRAVLATMYVGLASTVAAAAAPYADRVTTNTLARHIRAGYPAYTQSRIDAAADTYLVYLSVLGLLGSGAWLLAIRGVRLRRPWCRVVATVLFGLGLAVALFDLLVEDTSGSTGLPLSLGLIGVLPCLPGARAVYLLWRRAAPDVRTAGRRGQRGDRR